MVAAGLEHCRRLSSLVVSVFMVVMVIVPAGQFSASVGAESDSNLDCVSPIEEVSNPRLVVRDGERIVDLSPRQLLSSFGSAADRSVPWCLTLIGRDVLMVPEPPVEEASAGARWEVKGSAIPGGESVRFLGEITDQHFSAVVVNRRGVRFELESAGESSVRIVARPQPEVDMGADEEVPRSFVDQYRTALLAAGAALFIGGLGWFAGRYAAR